MITVLFIGLFLTLIILEMAAYAYFLQMGSRWAKIPNITFLRSVWACIAVSLCCIPVVFLNGAYTNDWKRTLFIFAIQLVLSLGLTWAIIARIFKTTQGKAIIAWLPTLILSGLSWILTSFVIIPYITEAFVMSANSMAPTILGQHWEAPCPRCGSPAYCTPVAPRYEESDKPVLMICSKERRTCEVTHPPEVAHGSDRILVAKFIRPQRWDIIVFHKPDCPEAIFCMRLIGLPGETVVIQDGSIWINGEKQTPPDSCHGIEYLDKMEGMPRDRELWGTKTNPAKLGPDEYFVLADFSANALDSRLWDRGAPGHPPYAVPESYIIGVVTHIYWPMNRFQILK